MAICIDYRSHYIITRETFVIYVFSYVASKGLRAFADDSQLLHFCQKVGESIANYTSGFLPIPLDKYIDTEERRTRLIELLSQLESELEACGSTVPADLLHSYTRHYLPEDVAYVDWSTSERLAPVKEIRNLLANPETCDRFTDDVIKWLSLHSDK